MAVTWVTKAGDLGTLTERISANISLDATSTTGSVSFSIIAGRLPQGLRLLNGALIGTPAEVVKFTTSRFVIRADDGTEKKDRTFSLSVEGSDIPEWITPEGFLNVGAGESYFVLDNAKVEFSLEATDPDLTAGDTLEYYLMPNSGELPPGLKLSKNGVISGFTDPTFALNYNEDVTGAYDSQAFDITPLDIAQSNTNGYDSYLFDNQIFDYSQSSRIPKKLSRIYAFTIAVSDGVNVVGRLFKIYVVTEEFLKADNNLVQVDTNLFRADSSSNRTLIWITDAYLGRYRANNYITIPIDVYDPPSLNGTIGYFLEELNDDGSQSQLPPGTTLDSNTGDVAGLVPYQAAVTKNYKFTVIAVNFPFTFSSFDYRLVGDWSGTTQYQVNDAVFYNGFIWIAKAINETKTPEEGDFWTANATFTRRTFNLDLIGEIESAIEWVTDTDLGQIKPNQPSQIAVEATTFLYGGRTTYELVDGELPSGLSFLPTGIIEGKVRQFATSEETGLTRFFDNDSGDITFSTVFDGENTSFDREFQFTVKASDYAGLAQLERTFKLTVASDTEKTFANIYAKALQPKDKRLQWFDFITDASIFAPEDLYRYGDVNFGVQTDLRVLFFAGIESVEAVKYVQAISKNHYNKRLKFGDVKKAKAKNPVTQETIYEVIYVDIVDEYEKNGKSISQTVELKDKINSPVLVSYDAIKVDSDIPFVSDSDHQRIFPNSVRNMRNRIAEVGDRDREFLPLWMRSIQDTATYELGFTKSLVLCYTKPGRADSILARIRANNFDFKLLDYVVDRYIIDIIDGDIEDKYLAFPQRGEKLP